MANNEVSIANIEKVRNLFGVKCYTFSDLVKYMYKPTDPSSLGVIRFLFGLLMLLDICEERGGAEIDIRWGEPKDCHFPLFPFLKPLSYPYMSLLYGVMWLGAVGIMLGFKFKLSIFLFGVPYWYILLLDKSFWNNHSYLFGVVTILFMGTSANHFCSIDGLLCDEKRNKHVPNWNYFILKFQFFMLYFLAGLKKTDFEWLEGYSMTHLGNHWVFRPFQFILTTDQIDYLIVHWFGFILDLTVGFWMLLDVTRPIAMVFCACFHLMNSRLFSIGMFPYVCLATMPLFCKETWPKKLLNLFFKSKFPSGPSQTCIYTKADVRIYKEKTLPRKITWKHKMVVALLIGHCGLQAFLPYSHFITQGYNNWTKGLYGYSWDMMVHSWNTVLVVVKVVDNNSGQEHFIDSQAWTQNDRWNKHADMCIQYAYCLKENLLSEFKKENTDEILTNNESKEMSKLITSENISIYIDVWCSLNGRFQQRMFNPNYDLLKAKWSPFRPVEWLLPLLSELNNFRQRMKEISEEVYSWSNNSEVLFIADFPGMYLENYINTDVKNVSLTVLEGDIVYEIEIPNLFQSSGIKLKKGEMLPIQVGILHKIHTMGSKPACYMYTFAKENGENGNVLNSNYDTSVYSPFPVIEDLQIHKDAFLGMVGHIYNSLLHVFFNKPVTKRSKIKSET